MASRKIFIDGSVFYAFTDRADANHAQSVKIMEQLSLQGVQLFTSIQSVQDVYSAINRQLGTTIGFDFLQAMIESDIEILYPQRSDLVSTYKLMRLNANKQISFKQALTANLMAKRNVVKILTFTYWHNLLGTEPYLQKF
jgi:predicted nucleic acid-binding protein